MTKSGGRSYAWTLWAFVLLVAGFRGEVSVQTSAASGSHQGCMVSPRKQAFVDGAEVETQDVVQVTATVVDDRGHYVRGLPQSSFHVTEDGRTQTISRFYSQNGPLDLVVAVGASQSMAQAMPALKKAVATFLGSLPPPDRVRLLGFNDSVFPALYEAILKGVCMLEGQAGRKALVVFTDAEDQGSHITIADVEQRLQTSDVALYMIGQGRGGVSSDAMKRLLARLSLPTGGRAYFAESVTGLGGAFSDLLEELSNQYVLGYQSIHNARDNRWRHIEVDVDGHHRVRARQGYRIRIPNSTDRPAVR